MALIACVALAGCAERVATIDIPYLPQSGAVSVAQSGAFTLVAVDERTAVRDRVALIKTEAGFARANIAAEGDIAERAANAVRQELETLGFRSGPGGVALTLFVTRFHTASAAGGTVASVALALQVADRDGIVIYETETEGGAVEPVASVDAKTARAALTGAFHNAVAGFVFDKRLRQAIVTGRVPAQPERILDAGLDSAKRHHRALAMRGMGVADISSLRRGA